jgi:hypothetical protein
MVDDPRIAKVARSVDRSWSVERAIPVSLTGFNPYTDAVYYARGSAFARWLADPHGSARDYNEGDFLVHEALFATHDYLHVWAVQLLRGLCPGRPLGCGRIDAGNLEALAFLHLLTEAVATVGLDYWYLATFDLDDLLGIGTDHRWLATDYRERDIEEHRRAEPGFTVQEPGFFTRLARFYCSGRWDGFGLEDLRRSPKTLRWLRHELSYGATQRRYTRMWLRHFAGVQGPSRDDDAPVVIDELWQERLLAEVGAALWRLVKEGRDERPKVSAVDDPWRSPEVLPADFRFVNANVASQEACDDASARWRAWQLISRYEYAAIDPELRAIVRDEACEPPRPRIRRLERLLRDVARLPDEPGEPRDLMLLN